MDLEGLDIIIEDGKVNGNNRQVHGTVKINGDMYDWNLEGDDDETCIFINKEENLIWDNRSFVEASLQCDEDLDMYDISEEDGQAVYDELLDLVNEGYNIEGWL
jgi:hypothetical protein|tara:strand:+ start:543 stop:854 length:312 start_codon:yes stop_codon:yes gene_type:complete